MKPTCQPISPPTSMPSFQPSSQPTLTPSTSLQSIVVYEIVSVLSLTTPFTEEIRSAYAEALKMTIPGIGKNDKINITKVVPITNSGNMRNYDRDYGHKFVVSITVGYNIEWTLTVVSDTNGPSDSFTLGLNNSLNDSGALLSALKNLDNATFADVIIKNVWFFELLNMSSNLKI